MPPKATPGVRVHVFKPVQPRSRHEYVQYSVPSAPEQGISASSSIISTNPPPPQATQFNAPQTHPIHAEAVENESLEGEPTPKARNKSSGDEALRDFIGQMDLFLAELVAIDGRGHFPDALCRHCNASPASYECIDCFGRGMYCKECIVATHQQMFLHRIQFWNGSYFSRSSLKELGLRIQLGHPIGVLCPRPERCRDDNFTVIDVFGVHNISLDFCGCGYLDQRHTVQLLRARIFPATIKNPRSGATFNTLNFFDLLAYESKTSAYELFQAISRSSDNTGTLKIKDRYHALLRMLREWRFLKMLKRSGRAHDPKGIAATKEGECAVLCPACPHPGKNMDPNWKTNGSPAYLNQLLLSMDACFRQKRKNVSSEAADPGLIQGLAYFVETSKVMAYLEAHISDVEPKSSCSRHDAVNMSERSNQGYAATGICAVVCSRHDMKRPTSVCDLQRGERYCNMDYVLYSSMQEEDSDLEYVTLAYDVVCQWEINFPNRLRLIDPEFFLLNEKTYVRFLVPKFHLPAHVSQCRLNYSFNLTKETGRTDGEATERGWVYLNALAPSAREMGPGSRRDTLDYHIGDENWKKVTGMGELIGNKLYDASLEMAKHVISHTEFTRSLSEDLVRQWTDEVKAWDSVKHDKKTKTHNPYAVTASGPTEAAVRRELAEEEAAELAAGRDMSLDDKVTPSVLIATGIELEQEQRSLKAESKLIWDHSQDRQKTRLILRTSALQRKIEAWTHYLSLYVPGITRLQENTTPGTQVSPIDVLILLPSNLKNQVSVTRQLQLIEFRLRHSQAHEALDQLQTQLQLRAHLVKHKMRFVRGQGPNTRMKQTIDGVEARINQLKAKYRAAYSALTSLSPLVFEIGWKRDLRELTDADVRDASEGLPGESEGTRSLSWIWQKATAGADPSSSEFAQERLRSEWCKSAARAERFKEEVCLLTEEMQRIWRYFTWKSESWLQKADDIPDSQSLLTSDPQKEALRAYALRQSDMYIAMRNHAQAEWVNLPDHVRRMQDIIADPELALSGEFDKTKASVLADFI